ncbi:SusC/RagA family TonB-linked outer membrane protein [Ohtaekwangia koreensis]|uniref:TonB-linked outer membrane protein, SusC/RagA family n=1 Tax=Ohtaekwangia koreensis TaxID=688867 RepID=A0A1T5MCT0_9BACT|nr:SusC/RagA family TonB-linked outer membrane protein [Ohtaekwangia koreensis]SKC86061.1 TonB-linked outer membrane protein, SusC/RagA family [Ohtaekwangia koreensis]
MRRTITQPALRLLLVVTCMMTVTQLVHAQVSATGKVTDETGSPLPGVSVLVKSTSRGTVTDANGDFSLQVSPEETLTFSFIGFKIHEVPVGSQTTFTIRMEPDAHLLKEVVAIGYQNIDRELSTASISTVRARDIENIPVPSANLALQGKVAGLTVLASSGEPGAVNSVMIRGSSNLRDPSLGSRTFPLYVVDGVLFDMNEIGSSATGTDPLSMINPNDIESIDVLKDASASTIYGSRAANGVIIIKTKRPKDGKPQIRLNLYGGVSLKPQMMPVYAGVAERRYKMDMIKKYAPRNELLYEQLTPFLTDSLNPAFNNNTDWQNMFLQNGTLSNLDFSIAQMNEKSSYRVSFNHYGEEGTLINTGFKRYQATVNLGATPSERLHMDLTLIGSFSDRKRGNGLQDKYPFAPWNFPSSFWQITDRELGIYTGAYNDVRDKNTDVYTSANFKTDLKLFSFLHWNVNASGFITNSRRDFAQASTISSSGTAEAYLDENTSTNWEVEQYFSFEKSFGKNNVGAIFGSSAKLFQTKHTFFRATNLNSDYYKTLQSINPSYLDPSSNTYVADYSRAAVFARINYDYDGKYLFSANWRMDGTSRYSSGNRWVHFPSVSAGWILSKERFWPAALGVNFFKVRGSYGVTGYDPGDPYSAYRKLTSYSTGWWQGLDGYGVTTYGGQPTMFTNYQTTASGSSLSWQKDPQWNIGFDTHLLDDRITLTVDFYHRESRNIPLEVSLPSTTGYTTGYRNVASVLNQGVEITLSTSNLPEIFPVRWNTNFTLAINKNMITALPNGGRTFKAGPPWLQYTLTKGRPIYEYSVWQVDGVYDSDEQVPVNPLTGERMKWYGYTYFGAGDPARRDMNGDYNIDDLDKVTMGNPNPKYAGGFNNTFEYKGITVGAYCYFVYGRKLWNGFFSDKFNGSQRYYSDWGNHSGPASSFEDLSFWTGPEGNPTFPGIFGDNNVDNYHIANSYFIDDGSFFRLKNIQLGYDFPRGILDKIKLQRLRVYGIWENVKVWHNANLPDPEVGDPSGYTRGDGYPLPHKFTLGIDINL